MRGIKGLRPVVICILALLASGCGTDDTVVPEKETGVTCDTIKWDLLLTSDERLLSAYRLFAFNTDPTANPTDTGIPYGLNTELFTDYASKYRFVFMPCDSAATYNENESFTFPVGTVITKTFAMPTDTSNRGIGNESLIETRLLIRRPAGWTTLAYVWLADGSDAVLDVNGESIAMSVTHKDTDYDFTYEVPSPSDCIACHTYKGEFSPIGPKARNLNGGYDYGDGLENQLRHWQAAGQLTGLPTDLNAIATVPVFDDDTEIAALTTEADRNLYAKAYLDNNCAHCHRQGSSFTNRTPYFEFWREIDTAVADNSHGICSVIAPGDPDASSVSFFMQSGFMPTIGTSLVHEEGLALINHWIENMAVACP